MRSSIGRRGWFPVLSAAGVMALASGIAYATIPDDDGVIHGCYSARGILRVIDPAVTDCSAGETALDWAAEGQPGPAGQDGQPGSQGVPGLSGRVVVQAVANEGGAAVAFCPEGKVVLGGGYNGGAAAVFNGPLEVLSPTQPGPQAWLVLGSHGDTHTAYAICATVAQ